MDRALFLHHILGKVSIEGDLEGAVRYLKKQIAAHPSASQYRLLLAEALMLLRPGWTNVIAEIALALPAPQLVTGAEPVFALLP